MSIKEKVDVVIAELVSGRAQITALNTALDASQKDSATEKARANAAEAELVSIGAAADAVTVPAAATAVG